MSQEYSTSAFPLTDADAVVLATSDEVPEKIDLIYLAVVSTPGQDKGQFGPVLCWEDHDAAEEASVWKIYAPHSLDNISHMKERLTNLVEVEAMETGDHGAPIISGMVTKNDHSWDSLVRAYRANDTWGSNLTLAIMETSSMASELWWAEFPAEVNDDFIGIYALSKLDSDSRSSLNDRVFNYAAAGAALGDVVGVKSRNSTAYKVAEDMYISATQDLIEGIEEVAPGMIEAIEAEAEESDEGIEFLRTAKI